MYLIHLYLMIICSITLIFNIICLRKSIRDYGEFGIAINIISIIINCVVIFATILYLACRYAEFDDSVVLNDSQVDVVKVKYIQHHFLMEDTLEYHTLLPQRDIILHKCKILDKKPIKITKYDFNTEY